MDQYEIIMSRKSIRTFDGRPLREEDRQKLAELIAGITTPYEVPVEFRFLDAGQYGLSSPVIRGETLYIAGKVKKQEHCEEAFGIAFEKLVLGAWALGIGTTWIGGTMDRAAFERAAGTEPDEFMPIVSPLGYPAEERADVDVKLRNTVHGDERLPWGELFFEGDFDHPLKDCEDMIGRALGTVRWAPSAANRQPCRVVRQQNRFHFYIRRTEGYRSGAAWDVQKIDAGIGLCHFMMMTEGDLSLEDPGIRTENDTDYIATITIQN